MMFDVDTTPPSHSDRREGLQKAAEMVIASLPVVGGALQVAFSDAMGRQLLARREEWLTQLAEAVNDLRDRIGDFEAAAENPDFVDAVITATQVADRTSRRLKREALRNAVLNSVLPSAPDADTQQLFFDLIDRFTPTHMQLLTHLDDPGGWFDRRGMVRPLFYSAPRTAVIEVAMPEFADRPDLIDRYANGLATNGLINSSLTGMMTGEGLWHPATTQLGREFLAFIQDPR
jgi:hypothetical protein